MGGSTYLHIYGFNRPVLDLCGGVGGAGDKLVGWLGLVGGRLFPAARFSLSSFLVYKLIILPLFFFCV